MRTISTAAVVFIIKYVKPRAAHFLSLFNWWQLPITKSIIKDKYYSINSPLREEKIHFIPIMAKRHFNILENSLIEWVKPSGIFI